MTLAADAFWDVVASSSSIASANISFTLAKCVMISVERSSCSIIYIRYGVGVNLSIGKVFVRV